MSKLCIWEDPRAQRESHRFDTDTSLFSAPDTQPFLPALVARALPWRRGTGTAKLRFGLVSSTRARSAALGLYGSRGWPAGCRCRGGAGGGRGCTEAGASPGISPRSRRFARGWGSHQEPWTATKSVPTPADRSLPQPLGAWLLEEVPRSQNFPFSPSKNRELNPSNLTRIGLFKGKIWNFL